MFTANAPRKGTFFLQRLAAGEPYADCDGSALPPTLNGADFTRFLQALAAGCSGRTRAIAARTSPI